MSNFEKNFNSGKNRSYRNPILFVTLGVIALLALWLKVWIVPAVAAAIVVGIYLVEKKINKNR